MKKTKNNKEKILMSRRDQDIPIRPRYGYLEMSTEGESGEDARKIQKKEMSQKSATPTSSYTEIPFLAQYLGPVPEDVLADMTPTAQKEPPCENECESEEEDNTNSKDSNSDEPNKPPKRPNMLQCDSSFPYELEGTMSNTGEMRHFVAHNLEAKLREGSPQRRYGSEHTTPSMSTVSGGLTDRFLQTHSIPEIDGNVLSDIEIETQYLATSVDNLMEDLCNLLHSISSITADNVEVHKNAVNKLTDNMDTNIKCMYTIMAKTEEITKSMRPTEQLGQRIREIKRLVDMLDNTM